MAADSGTHVSALPSCPDKIYPPQTVMDDSILQMYERCPLIAFSPLTHVQVEGLLTVGKEVSNLIDRSAIGKSRVDAVILNQAYVLLWLWILGAYEVTRTMSQAKPCFTDELLSRIDKEKRYLAKLRIPLAKQELAGDPTKS